MGDARLAAMTNVADAYLIAVDSVVDLLRRPEVAAAWDQPSALAEWTVGGLAGHLAGQAFAGVSLIEAEPSELTPIALDEHYARVTWIGAAVDDEQSVDIRSGGDANAEAGPSALLAGWSRPATGWPCCSPTPRRTGRCWCRGRAGRCAATTSW